MISLTSWGHCLYLCKDTHAHTCGHTHTYTHRQIQERTKAIINSNVLCNDSFWTWKWFSLKQFIIITVLTRKQENYELWQQKKKVLKTFLLSNLSVWIWILNIELEFFLFVFLFLFLFFVACFDPSLPAWGTCYQRVNCVRLSVLWMSTIMLLWSMGLLGFVWLFVSPHSVFVRFGWPGLLSVWLAVTVCAAIKPVIQMVSTPH